MQKLVKLKKNLKKTKKISKQKKQKLNIFFKNAKPYQQMVKKDVRLIPRPCKLINTRNNCFFNSAIQLTLYVHPVTTFFESAEFQENQPICKSFQKFIKDYCKNEVLDPQIFINSMSEKIRIFNGDEQDAQEFLILFYNVLSRELGLLDNVSIENSNQLRSISKKNTMVKTFYGILSNTVKCMNCNKKSLLTHQFSNLTLHVTNSIQESVNKFLETEINPSESKCEECKKISKVMVSKEFLYLPEILVIQLSRYYRDRKNNNFVVINEKLKIAEKTYSPIGFICHTGTLENGHYTAYAKVHSKWYLFDDTSVHEVNFDDCNKRGAYILFYSRI